jgi:ABC-type transporter Mla MlaB component
MSKRKSAPSSNSAVQSKQTFALPAECVIANAGSLRESLVSLAKVADLTLDASALQRLDTACLQLLAAFVCERRMADHAISWTGAPALLADRAQLLGLAEALALAAHEGAA